MSPPDRRPQKSRRRFLAATSKALALAAGAGLSRRVLAQTNSSVTAAGEAVQKVRGFPFEELDGFITPTDRFFLRSHLEVPRLDPARFRLQIGGLVERPLSFSLEQLRQLPQVTRPVTFECSGNGIGGVLVSTAEWSGPLLGPILAQARPRPEAIDLLMEGADAGMDELVAIPLQYARSVYLETLKEMPAMLALRMNGEPLRPEHGFPVRVILPGLYGVQHVKWLMRLTLLPTRFRGFYQTQRYIGMRRSPHGIEVHEIVRQRVKSQIARIELEGGGAGRNYRITGAAWSGGDGIRGVEISTDGGRSWAPAVMEPARDRYAWVLWSYRWKASPGTHEVMARATDESGRRQPLTRDPAMLTGYINNWCERKRFTVPA